MKVNKFSEYLYLIRNQQSLTILDLAQKSYLSCSAIMQFERGIRLPSPEAIDRLARALNIDRYILDQLALESRGSIHCELLNKRSKR